MLFYLLIAGIVICFHDALAMKIIENGPAVKTGNRTNFEERIVGGENASVSDFPFMVSVQFMNSHICGGSLHTPTWVITAAHCCYVEGIKLGIGDLGVLLGTTYSRRILLGEDGARRGVLFVLPHDGYSDMDVTPDYDIALLRLSHPVQLSKVIALVTLQLPSDQDPAEDATVTVVGWGYTSPMAISEQPSAQASPNLQKVDLKVFSRDKCDGYYQGLTLTSRHICAYADNKDSCVGDSGGPLIYSGRQIAIVSFGQGCALGLPGVYQRVAPNMDWLRRIVASGRAGRTAHRALDAVCAAQLLGALASRLLRA